MYEFYCTCILSLLEIEFLVAFRRAHGRAVPVARYSLQSWGARYCSTRMTEPNDEEVIITIQCTLDGEEIELSRDAAATLHFSIAMEDMDSNILPVGQL